MDIFIFRILTILVSGFEEILGFKVADIAETFEHFQTEWLEVIENNGDIKSVIKKYNDLGFNAAADLPIMAYWKELYINMETCKVVLTVRNDSQTWAKSFQN